MAGDHGAEPRLGVRGGWRTLSVATGIAGLASLVLVGASQALVQVGGGEPAFDAPAAEILGFLEARHETLFAVGSYLGVLAMVAFVWFAGGLWALLREAEGEPAWRSTVALVFAVLFAAMVMSPGWELAGFRVGQGVEADIAQYAFDMGNLGFANGWLALAGFLAAAGWVIVAARRPVPVWLGWLAVVAGALFLVARAVWTTFVWLIPYSLFWVWLIAVSVLLIRRRGPAV